MTQVNSLAAAAAVGDISQMQVILREDPDAAKNWKPLMDAAFHGQPRAVTLLLTAGADPDVVSGTAHHHRPLHRAIEHSEELPRHAGHDEVIRILLEAGADPSSRGGLDRVTPVALAAIGGETRFLPVLTLLDRRRDIFTAAVLVDDGRVGSLLDRDPELVNARDENLWTPLIYAVASRLGGDDGATAARQRTVVTMLLDAGADPDASAFWSEKWPLRALFFAAGRNYNPDLTKLLLERGANPNDGESIHHAAEGGHLECLQLLHDHGANLDFNDPPYNTTPLWFLIHWGFTKSVPWLLEHGADPNRRSAPRGETVLHAAARRGVRRELLEMLVAHGADPTAVDDAGKTPLDLAREKGKTKAVDYLSSLDTRP